MPGTPPEYGTGYTYSWPMKPGKKHAPRGRKYGNRRTELDGIVFDSKLESEEWARLRLLERAGEITELRRQVTIPLYAYDRLICRIRLDFTWTDKQGNRVYADAKGFVTPDWELKRKLFEAQEGTAIVLLRKRK